MSTMKNGLGLVIAMALAFGLLLVPSGAEAQDGDGEYCYDCEGGVCDETDGWGGESGCQTVHVCHEGWCDSSCGPDGEVCGPAAVAMSGQVVLSLGAEVQGLTFDEEEGVYRRACDGAVVMLSDDAALEPQPVRETIVLK